VTGRVWELRRSVRPLSLDRISVRRATSRWATGRRRERGGSATLRRRSYCDQSTRCQRPHRPGGRDRQLRFGLWTVAPSTTESAVTESRVNRWAQSSRRC
jgi:hypothetical protein